MLAYLHVRQKNQFKTYFVWLSSISNIRVNVLKHVSHIIQVAGLLFGHVFGPLTSKGQRRPEGGTFATSGQTERKLCQTLT